MAAPTGLAGLLRTRRFWPLCAAQACTAFNDNLVKNALVVLALMKAGAAGPVIVASSAGLFILPYVLLSATAGQLADRHDKAWLIRIMKLAELALLAVCGLGLWRESIPVLLLVLIALGVQATFFGPLKYGILPDHLRDEELVGGNGLVEATTFISILLGTVAGGGLVLLPSGPLLVAGAGLGVGSLGLVTAAFIPPAPPRAREVTASWNILRETIALVGHAREHRGIWLPILALSWFWTVGATMLAEVPVVATVTLGATGQLVTLFLTAFTIGVGVGSIGCAALLKGEVSARHVPLAALGISLFTLDFAASCAGAEGLTTVSAFLAAPAGWRMLADLLLLAACGGLYSVPLYALIQERADPAFRARTIAANNVMNAAFMVAGAGVAAALAARAVAAPHILTALGFVNLGAAFFTILLLPYTALRWLAYHYLRLFHGLSVRGLEHYPPPDRRAVVVVNHLSLADGPVIAGALPGTPVFAVDRQIARRWWAEPFFTAAEVVEINTANPFAIRVMIQAVRDGRRLVVFPEGRITRTGGLMKVYDGAAMIADRAGAEIVPVRLDGTQFSFFSSLRGKVRRRAFPRVSVTVRPPVRFALAPDLMGRRRRVAAAAALQDCMIDAAFAAQDTGRTLLSAVLDAHAQQGGRAVAFTDADFQCLTYNRLLLGACVLGRAIAAHTRPGQPLGVLLPNANGAVVTFFALLAFGRIPAMLNVTGGAEGMLSACRIGGIEVVLSSRRFVERGRLAHHIEGMQASVRFVWLEDVRAGLGFVARMRGLWDVRRARRLPGCRAAPDEPAVVLFTSGTEGMPKGVVLSHRNILTNCAQSAAVIDFNPADRLFNALPMFHAFGLTVGTLMPAFFGVRAILYPSPLHYRIVPEMIYDNDATIVLATDTFLTGWARYANPFDFRSVRYLFAGAERVREETRRLYADRFGVRILEGYGATETAPVLAINTALRSRTGTVGRFMPGIGWRLTEEPGLAEGERLWVRGGNVMLGYLRADGSGEIETLPDGWYDTGDIVTIDADGFVTVRDRIRRFAKIAGEMIPMAVGEELATALWPTAQHAVVAVPDSRRGERLLLVTTEAAADVPALLAAARARGVPEIMVPRTLLTVERMPRLGSGKIDYQAAQRLATAALEVSAA
jgi:acyl-[acyl-carrier-protein]-phospholipid O-acyltransferase/long-chain-fatty-acid--[acyl-carrier-protein] ligase